MSPPINDHRILVTGANGFVGRGLCRELLDRKAAVTAAVRNIGDFHDFEGPLFQQITVGEIDQGTAWDEALMGVDTIFHLAARVHVMRESGADALRAYRRVNVEGTERLARAAAKAGVKRLVFLSSIKVNGEATSSKPYTAEDLPHPQNAYAISKWEAEQALWRLSLETGLQVVVVRTPLVYGPGVKGNFLRLLEWVNKGIPLPFAAVENRRSMIYLRNLVDAMIACAEHPIALGRTYLVSDGEDVSLPELIRLVASAMGKPARLWRGPESLMRVAAALLGKSAEANRLLDSLLIDCTPIRKELGWMPPDSMKNGIHQTADWYSRSLQKTTLTDNGAPV